ncbi:MAG: conjugal transfer protein TraO [Gammaproteobacteria bacterium]|nr:conjugal transfer protein TraO [Gammaproteobacteria bacterium]
MKQRLIVMNGQRIAQIEQGGTWKNQRVDKAGALKPGIYNLYMAQQADKTSSHDGLVVYADSASVYQQIGKKFVMHSLHDFDIAPAIGSTKRINYDAQGKAQVSAMAAQRGRSRSR